MPRPPAGGRGILFAVIYLRASLNLAQTRLRVLYFGLASAFYTKETKVSERKRRVFVICPVRNADPEVVSKIEAYIKKLEADGRTEVYWPYRDTDQVDPIGFRICCDNGQGIYRADEIHFYYDPKSEGSKFDFGMLFMASAIIGPKKKVVIINRGEVIPTEGKSFANVLLALATE